MITRDVVKKSWPFLAILMASAVAHGWCLGSVFYMDDFPQIRDNEVLKSGRIWESKLLAWTHFWQWIQFQAFGASELGFHAVNWLLHTAVACVLYGLARDLIRGKWPDGVALFAALWFVVHPLGSEIPNYARTQDLAWVTLFSLLSAWAMLRYLSKGGWELVRGINGEIPVFQRTRRWWKLVLCGLAVFGATFSKGPGLFHAVMAVAVVGLAYFPREWGKAWGKITLVVLAALAVVVAVVWATGMTSFTLNAIHQWQEPRFVGHALTVTRVFWEFAWRAVLPVGLSADHHIAETLVPNGLWNVPDKIALVSAVSMLALGVLGLYWTCRERSRLVGVCLTIFVGTMAFRVLYLIPEYMPEYRIYPGLPWFCLGAAVAMASAWKWMFPHVSPRWIAGIFIAALALLSAKRSFLWHDLDRLMADVLKRYPMQARAIWELHQRDLDAGNVSAVIQRQERDFPEIRRRFIASLGEMAPARELPTGHFSLAEVVCVGCYARAVAISKSPQDGVRLISELEKYMLALKIDPKTNPTHWEHFARDKALVYEIAGDLPSAIQALEREGEPPRWPKEYARLKEKWDAVK